MISCTVTVPLAKEPLLVTASLALELEELEVVQRDAANPRQLVASDYDAFWAAMKHLSNLR